MSSVALVVLSLFCASCVTNDFEVVDAIRPGMSQVEVADIVKSYGFERQTVLNRPEIGWASKDGTFENVQGRALAVEQRLQQQVAIAEACPVGHGLFGLGILYLFYGSDGKLLEHYRYQIN